MSIINRKQVSVHSNQDFILIRSCAVHRRVVIDPNGYFEILPCDTANMKIGEALCNALNASRMIKTEELDAYFLPKNKQQHYENWIDRMLKQFSYGNKKKLFSKMKSCIIIKEEASDTIIFRPMEHARLEVWSADNYEESDYIKIIQSVSTAETIGQSLKQCLEKCTA